MQLNNIFYKTILIISIILMTACNSYKSVDTESVITTKGSKNQDIKNHHVSNNDQVYLPMEMIYDNNTIYFNLDKYNISFEFTRILDIHAKFLRDNPSCKVTIEGHADARGTPEYNIILGERRGNAVKMYLQGKGVSTDQIMIVSYGEEKPVLLGHNELAYAKNRRAILVY